MAIRRAKQKAQVIEKLSSVAPAGETFIACVHCETGPSPWLNAVFDEVPGLGLAVALTREQSEGEIDPGAGLILRRPLSCRRTHLT